MERTQAMASGNRIHSGSSLTPLMIRAGIAAWVTWDQTDDSSLENLVTSVFQAMTLEAGPVAPGAYEPLSEAAKAVPHASNLPEPPVLRHQWKRPDGALAHMEPDVCSVCGISQRNVHPHSACDGASRLQGMT